MSLVVEFSNIKDPLKMINDSLFEMSDSDLNHYEMIDDCHFEMTAKIFVTRFILVNKYILVTGPQRWKLKFPSLRSFYFRQQAHKVCFLETQVEIPYVIYVSKLS